MGRASRLTRKRRRQIQRELRKTKSRNRRKALRRELKEELDIDTKILKKISFSPFTVKNKPYELHCYRVVIESGEPRAKEHHMVSWVSIENLLDLSLAPADIPIAKEVYKYDW